MNNKDQNERGKKKMSGDDVSNSGRIDESENINLEMVQLARMMTNR